MVLLIKFSIWGWQTKLEESVGGRRKKKVMTGDLAWHGEQCYLQRGWNEVPLNVFSSYLGNDGGIWSITLRFFAESSTLAPWNKGKELSQLPGIYRYLHLNISWRWLTATVGHYEGFKIFLFIGSYRSAFPPRQILFNIQTHHTVGMRPNVNIYLFAHYVHGLHDAPWHETMIPG